MQDLLKLSSLSYKKASFIHILEYNYNKLKITPNVSQKYQCKA